MKENERVLSLMKREQQTAEQVNIYIYVHLRTLSSTSIYTPTTFRRMWRMCRRVSCVNDWRARHRCAARSLPIARQRRNARTRVCNIVLSFSLPLLCVLTSIFVLCSYARGVVRRVSWKCSTRHCCQCHVMSQLCISHLGCNHLSFVCVQRKRQETDVLSTLCGWLRRQMCCGIECSVWSRWSCWWCELIIICYHWYCD